MLGTSIAFVYLHKYLYKVGKFISEKSQFGMFYDFIKSKQKKRK